MSDFNLQDAYLLEQVIDPGSEHFARLMGLLMKPPADDRTRAEQLRSKGEWKHTLPFRGESEDEMMVRDRLPFVFDERAQFRNGICSLAIVISELLDLVILASNKTRISTTVCVTAECDTVIGTVASSRNVSTLIHYTSQDAIMETILDVQPETLIFDHTSVNAPIDEVLNMAYRNGVRVVDGIFPYHVASQRGWDIVFGMGKWSYTRTGDRLTVGPDDDCTRMMNYDIVDFRKFTDPKLWKGNSRKYGYEIRKCQNGVATYRAVYLDGHMPEDTSDMAFNLPLCSSDDMILININRDLAAGVFASKSNNAQDLASSQRDYAIEVRKELFVSCVNYLMIKDQKSDIVGDSIRYINQHNYVDLVEGVRIIRCPSLNYADALCVSMVCSLTAFSLRYRLTNESIRDIERQRTVASLKTDAPLGALGRLAWLAASYVYDAGEKLAHRARQKASLLLETSDYIPGVCFDIYTTTYYQPDLNWFQPELLELDMSDRHKVELDDPFTSFLGGQEKTYAPTAVRTKNPDEDIFALSEHKYVRNIIPDPKNALQHVYDQAFPGNSTGQIQNAAELRRVRDINVNTEFFGKIEVNKDIAAPEKLHVDAPIRTAAIPVSNTPLLDAIMASAKRNFNPPDIQQQSDPWAYAQYLARRFIDWALVPSFRDTIGKSYKKDPISFNVSDYLEWRATRDGNYRSALEAECPNEMVELDLEKYDTIVKKRIKPKLSVAAQYELSQPQVIVSMSKRSTAPFTSVFRKIFERFDSSLRSEIKSAGRSSDDDISRWLTTYKTQLLSFTAVELDSSKFDKSQGLLARMIESYIMIELGLDPGVSEIFSDSYVGRVSSRALGIYFVSAYQMKSGAPQTMLGNLIYNMVSAMESVGPENIRFMIAKGDDNVLWLSHSISLSEAQNKMAGLFNLEVKLITDNVLYFSSGYIVPVGERVYFVPDPIKIVELLGETGASPLTIEERFISFQDRINSITRESAIVSTLKSLVRRRLGIHDLDVVMCVDALAALASDFMLFKSVVL